MSLAEFLRKALMAECHSSLESDPSSQHWCRKFVRHFPHIFCDHFICLSPRFCCWCGRVNMCLSDLGFHRATYPQTGWYSIHDSNFSYARKRAAVVIVHLVATAFLSCHHQKNRSVIFLGFSSWDNLDRNVAEKWRSSSIQYCIVSWIPSFSFLNVKAMRKEVA